MKTWKYFILRDPKCFGWENKCNSTPMSFGWRRHLLFIGITSVKDKIVNFGALLDRKTTNLYICQRNINGHPRIRTKTRSILASLGAFCSFRPKKKKEIASVVEYLVIVRVLMRLFCEVGGDGDCSKNADFTLFFINICNASTNAMN